MKRFHKNISDESPSYKPLPTFSGSHSIKTSCYIEFSARKRRLSPLPYANEICQSASKLIFPPDPNDDYFLYASDGSSVQLDGEEKRLAIQKESLIRSVTWWRVTSIALGIFGGAMICSGNQVDFDTFMPPLLCNRVFIWLHSNQIASLEAQILELVFERCKAALHLPSQSSKLVPSNIEVPCKSEPMIVRVSRRESPKEVAEKLHLTAPEQAVAVSVNGTLRDFNTPLTMAMRSSFGILTTRKEKKSFGTPQPTSWRKPFCAFGPMHSRRSALRLKMDSTTTLAI